MPESSVTLQQTFSIFFQFIVGMVFSCRNVFHFIPQIDFEKSRERTFT